MASSDDGSRRRSVREITTGLETDVSNMDNKITEIRELLIDGSTEHRVNKYLSRFETLKPCFITKIEFNEFTEQINTKLDNLEKFTEQIDTKLNNLEKSLYQIREMLVASTRTIVDSIKT